jgi:hypothetical protein
VLVALSTLSLQPSALSRPAEPPGDPPAPTPAGSWSYDVIHLKNGTCFRGLIVEESAALIRFQNIRRQPGRPTVVFATTFRPDEVRRINRLPDDERSLLKARLAELDPSGRGEERRMEKLELQRVAWNGKPDAGLRYDSDHFVLTSDAPSEVVRRVAVRLEQIDTAFVRYLPPRHEAGAPTSIILVRSLEEYRALLRQEGRPILNPAFFDPATDRLVCASDFERLGEDLERVRQQHQELLAEVDRLEADLAGLPKSKVPPRYRQLIRETRQRVAQAERTNDRAFNKATEQLLATLYHEAFHAYLLNFVYPPAQGELPRWLNEGLAQLFETAIIEADDLRVGHADARRLERAKDALRKGELVPLADLLRSGSRPFLLLHGSDRQASDRAYLTAWALAHYLTFERRLLGGPAMDRYVKRLHEGADPREALAELVGQPVEAFERDFHRYVQLLQLDGSPAAGLPEPKPN